MKKQHIDLMRYVFTVIIVVMVFRESGFWTGLAISFIALNNEMFSIIIHEIIAAIKEMK